MKLNRFYDRLGLGQQIVLPFITVFLVVLVLATLILGSWFSETLEQTLAVEVNSFSTAVLQGFRQKQQDLQSQLKLLVSREMVKQALEKRDTATLLQQLLPLKAELAFNWVKIVTPQGTVLADLRDDALEQAKFQEDAVLSAAKSGLYFSDLMHIEGTPQTLLIETAPVRSREQLLGGMVVGMLIQDALLQNLTVGSPQQLIAFKEGKVLATTLPEMRNAAIQLPTVGAPAKRISLAGLGYIAKSVMLTGNSKAALTLTVLYPVTSLDVAKQVLWLRLGILFGLGGLIVAVIGIQIGKALATRLRLQFRKLQQALQNLRETQSQLIQAEKMSSLGQLVAGVAHEINNPVGFIKGNLNYVNQYTQDLLILMQLYQQHYPNPDAELKQKSEEIDLKFLTEDLVKILSSMHVGVDRISQIVLSLRTFSRLDEADMKEADLHEGIDSTLLILNHRLKYGINVIKHYGKLPLVECYPAQLNQVFMNLLANAIDALEESKTRAQQAENDFSPEITLHTERISATSVNIRIQDNGVGMSPITANKIFDAFFTTKPAGKGTGLGLSISYQIIKKHQGNIELKSEVGKGTEFSITLPIRQPLNPPEG